VARADHQYHQALNDTLGFIDAKVKAAQKKMLEPRLAKCEEHQGTGSRDLIHSPIKRDIQVWCIRKQREEHKKVYLDG